MGGGGVGGSDFVRTLGTAPPVGECDGSGVATVGVGLGDNTVCWVGLGRRYSHATAMIIPSTKQVPPEISDQSRVLGMEESVRMHL